MEVKKMPKIYEYRGVEGLVYAPIVADTKESFQTGAVKDLAGVAEISKSTNSSNEAHYYDNLPAVVVSSTGSDEITITASAIPLDVLADITGQYYDAQTGSYVEKERTPKYFAIGYKTKTTDGVEMFVWRLKGTFNIPDETNATENDGTDANGQELTFTGISTIHKFTKTGSSAKAITVDTSVNPVDESTFFGSVQTPDTVTPAVVVPSVSVVPSRAVIDAGSSVALQAIVVPAGAAVTWTSSAQTYATVDEAGVVTGAAEGSATITASITVDGTNYTDTCAVTVNAVEA
jgi:phi13 family phage major tail protein